MKTSAEERLALASMIAEFREDPLLYVMCIYPWGEGDLAGWTGPDAWQTVLLQAVGKQIKEGRRQIRIAVASGHGIGKTAVIAWIIDWFTSCYQNGAGVVTANTKAQLTTKTWRELNKWKQRSRLGWMKVWSATAYKHKAAPELMVVNATPWSKANTQAFAGLHEEYVLVCFDEASNIIPEIWETTEGAMTTRGFWFCFGNPMNPGGRFSQCWNKFKARWTTMRVDSRRAKAADKGQIEQWRQDYGEDSDFFRTRVKGEEASAAPMQLIAQALVDNAVARRIEQSSIPPTVPRCMGVDIARQGDDDSVIVRRQGRLLLPIRKNDVMHIDDLMRLAGRVVYEINEWQPDLVFVDATGMGAGVYDRLIQLGYTQVVPVVFAERANDYRRYHNVRMEVWDRMKAWLATASIPDHDVLKDDLRAPQYAFTSLGDRMILERKEDIKRRTGRSPDIGDAVALTFAEAVPLRRDDGRATEPDVT